MLMMPKPALTDERSSLSAVESACKISSGAAPAACSAQMAEFTGDVIHENAASEVPAFSRVGTKGFIHILGMLNDFFHSHK